MIEIREKKIYLHGEPILIMSGEIHYFRLPRDQWQQRIDLLKEAGCNAISTYIPWIVHEPVEGQYDLTGQTRGETDLAGFLKLCEENELYVFVRPGPFIMAEMKNEGIPHWVYQKHPEAIPVGWDGAEPTTPTLDYMAGGFLQEVRNWYRAVLPLIRDRLITNGGRVIAIQLDNEVGMLAWVSNTPDLTDSLLDDFMKWTADKYEGERYSRYPFLSRGDDAAMYSLLRSPSESYAPALRVDLGEFMRDRFAAYIATLRRYCEEEGVRDIPFVVNIHGTGGGRGFTFPIGISQLYKSYTQDEGYLSGSDIYFGDMTLDMFQDVYLINAFMDSVHLPDQPLTSVEFNCGDGNFGNTLSGRKDPSAADLTMRMCVAQGNRLINYYLFAGGYNYRMDQPYGDGNDRIAFTGERHGFAAPVSPEGKKNYTFHQTAESIQRITAAGDKLAGMQEEKDRVAFAFIPDYYMTEYRYPSSKIHRAVVENIEQHRAGGAWELAARSMLLNGFRFGAVNLQTEFPVDQLDTLVVPSAAYMSADIQSRLVNFMKQGGSVLLIGDLPRFDLEGRDCIILSEALGVSYHRTVRDSHRYYLSIVAEGFSKAYPEVRSHVAHTVSIEKHVTPLLRVYDTEEVCGFESPVGKGKAIGFFTHYSCDTEFFRELFARLRAEPVLTHTYGDHGIFMTSVANEQHERFLHMINLDGLDKSFQVMENGEALFDGLCVELPARRGLMLPVNVQAGPFIIQYATAEMTAITDGSVTFAWSGKEMTVLLKADAAPISNQPIRVEQLGDQLYRVYANVYDCRGENVKLYCEK